MNLGMNAYKPAFRANLQISGNTKLLDKDQVKHLKGMASEVGSDKDVIDIHLPYETRDDIGDVSVAGYVNGMLAQYTQRFENNNVYRAAVSGLVNAKEVFGV